MSPLPPLPYSRGQSRARVAAATPTLAQDRREMIDDETRTMFDRVKVQALRDGTDLAEALNRSGLLLTARKKKIIQFNVLNNMVGELEQVHPSQLLRLDANANGRTHSEDSTPLTMYGAVILWLNAWIRRVQ